MQQKNTVTTPGSIVILYDLFLKDPFFREGYNKMTYHAESKHENNGIHVKFNGMRQGQHKKNAVISKVNNQ